MKYLYLTTANLPTNPRLLKEIDSLSKDNTVTVLLFKLGNWSDSLDECMQAERQHIQFIRHDATRENFKWWLVWAVAEKIARIVYPFFKNCLTINALAHSRRALQLRKSERILSKPDIIIAHNLGALYSAFIFSKKWKIPFIYDIEDYDPGIYVPEAGKQYVAVCETILKKCLPSAHRLTSASPLIGQYTLNLIGGHAYHSVVLNSFWSNEFVEPVIKDPNAPLSFVWFSQRISYSRGLEQFFAAIQLISHPQSNIELTLIGDLDLQFSSEWIKPMIVFAEQNSWFKLKLIQAIPQKDLHVLLAEYDIGLAIEPGKDLNNTLAISNKIIAYAQAGLYIMATNTPAQKKFIDERKERGVVCGQTVLEMSKTIKLQVKSRAEIRANAPVRFESGKALAWENCVQRIDSMLK